MPPGAARRDVVAVFMRRLGVKPPYRGAYFPSQGRVKDIAPYGFAVRDGKTVPYNGGDVQFTSGNVKVKVVKPSTLVTEISSPWLQTMVFTM